MVPFLSASFSGANIQGLRLFAKCNCYNVQKINRGIPAGIITLPDEYFKAIGRTAYGLYIV